MFMQASPSLDPPGAGLPSVELWIGRRIFHWKLRTGSLDRFDREFREERQATRLRIDDCPEALRGERVLIRRLRGLEDSSRHWSVWMTLDHLRICHQVFAGVIRGLVAGRVPERAASTADVKPSPEVGAEVDGSYEKSCDDFLDLVRGLPDLKSEARFAHPWFGPLDAAGWHALAAMHLGIHRKQIERIVAGLR